MLDGTGNFVPEGQGRGRGVRLKRQSRLHVVLWLNVWRRETGGSDGHGGQNILRGRTTGGGQ